MKTNSLHPIATLIPLVALAACSSKGGDTARQYGPDPYLPEPHEYLMPPMSVPKATGWKTGEMPTAAGGLKIEALATGLEHPRTLYTLPNGDILVVESNSPGTEAYRPKDFIAGKVKARAGAGSKGGNRITLIRPADGDGKPELRTVFIDHLYSPYGIVLVGDTLYVANTDAILAFNYVPGMTRITSPGVKLADLPGGPLDHHWTKSMTASSDGSKLYVGVGSNSNVTENGMAVEEGRAAIYEVDRLTGAKRIFVRGTRRSRQGDAPHRLQKRPRRSFGGIGRVGASHPEADFEGRAADAFAASDHFRLGEQPCQALELLNGQKA